MFSTLRNRFGIPGVISVIALVFAMFGGAYAASNSSGGGKATASAKAKQGPRGKTGKTGPAGPQGPAGAAGPAGAKGDAGAAGPSGSNGASATTASFSGNQHGCLEGGVEVKSAGAPTYVCNGEEGQQGTPGQDGSPWTLGGTLPPNAMETGTYSIISETGTGSFAGFAVGTVSFPIPLAEGIAADHVIYLDRSEAGAPPIPANCENPEHAGSADGVNPEAAPGYLCIYETKAQAMNASEMEFIQPNFTGGGTGKSGTVLLQVPTGEKAFATGTWAVTAPLAP